MSARPRAYLICTSPRSGSTLLCHMLRACDGAGWPGSHFHEPDVAAWRQAHALAEAAPLGAVFDAGEAAGRREEALFGLRLQRRSAPYFFGTLRQVHPAVHSDRDAFEAQFGATVFIHLEREDATAQAVSFVKAEQVGL